MKIFSLHRNIYITGLVSMFMDMSSEMVYPLVPLFLASVLGVNKSLIGLIEGIAESTASLLRVFSGWFSDRIGRRKGLMGAGYGISTLSRPIVAIATGWHMVLGYRFVDRLGKGIRTAPRDAIIADSTEVTAMGRAYGFQRAMDTMGAVVGPAIAYYLLSHFEGDFRKVFWCSVIPGVVAVLLIVFFIKEKKKAGPGQASPPKLTLKVFDWRFKFFILIATLFSIGNSSDVFLILRAQQEGIHTLAVPVLYLMFNVVYSMSAVPAGLVADRYGMRRVILAGFVLFTLIYLGFANARGTTDIWVLFAAYGVFMGLNEGILKAFLAQIAPREFKATAFGIYNTAIGLALLPASVIGGWLWDHIGPSATFYYGSATAAASAVLFVVFMATTKRAV
jgi:MFS family permease